MKKIMITLTLLSSISSYACQCYGPSYGSKNADQAAIKFMNSKRGVDNREILSVESEHKLNYLTMADKMLIKTFVFLDSMISSESRVISQCEIGCAKAQNTKYKTIIGYQDSNGNSCTQELLVKLEAYKIKDGYKSFVKKKVHPICD